ncbi:RsfA family transcriptional regulator [Peribacillus asahii]|uniref:RsfA family transcriptional regulator n=1 Tax=Peribacillus asahii TaxID=228899 RepID=A0A398BC89_9BACI|nr:RsfA family transcriptional regulator [Peribacillus asahii]RID87685.1 RsfA family transcriptional regulator [Peribacillus asahii]
MSIARQDAWSQDEDLLLAEVVLRYIREGSTQLRAFEEVGKQLSRTPAACGFRWNSFVRKQYKSGIELAKKQRKENKGQRDVQLEEKLERKVENMHECTQQVECVEENKVSDSVSFQEIVSYLKKMDETARLYEQEKQQRAEELGDLQRENQQLREEIKVLQSQLVVVEEDYRALLHIMERARKLIIHEDDPTSSKVKFQMDKNGNLERVNK